MCAFRSKHVVFCILYVKMSLVFSLAIRDDNEPSGASSSSSSSSIRARSSSYNSSFVPSVSKPRTPRVPPWFLWIISPLGEDTTSKDTHFCFLGLLAGPHSDPTGPTFLAWQTITNALCKKGCSMTHRQLLDAKQIPRQIIREYYLNDQVS